MKKLTDYFYIFSKLTTSLVLIIIIFIMGILIFNSYQDKDKASDINDNKLDSLADIVNLNKLEINRFNKKFDKIDSSINKILAAIENDDKAKNQNIYDKELKTQEVAINKLKDQINKILLNKNLNNKKNLYDLQDKNLKKETLIDFILIKYQNGENINEELSLLEKISPNNNQIFEKLNLITLKKYLGKKNLENLFKISTNNFLESKIKKKYQNMFINFVMKFITIELNDTNIYDHEQLNNIQQAQKLFIDGDYKGSLSLILLVDKKQIYYDSWIKQLNIYVVFEETLKRII